MKTTPCPARTVILLSSLALLVTGAVLYAGPLDPPAGPVTSTYKTLTEVEPRTAINATNTPGDADSLFKITQPGSYYLAGNITGVVGKHGIEIVASGVTLDLNGFDLLGVAGSLDGVSATVGNLTNIAVVNGSVRNWGDEGVDLGTISALNCRVEGVRANGNADNGIFTGIGSTVADCSAFQNTGVGIIVSSGCTITNCSAYQNVGNGISAGTGCTVINCSANSNTGSGISTGTGSTVSNCSASSNTAGGISTGIGCTVSNCSTSSNTANGISVSNGCTVSNCSAFQNTGSGISTGEGSTVADCTARNNTLDGIVCTSRCVIRGNTCASNGFGPGDGAGIHATFNDNRIEGNNCTGADRGIDVDVAGSIIVRNTCSGNFTSNWDIAAGNVCLVVQGVTGAAILGNIGGVAPGSTDPNANFSY